MAVRKTERVETRMISEYVVQTYGKYPHMFGVPLGRVSEELMKTAGYQAAIKMSRPYRPEADAIVVLPGALLIIEAKVWNIINGLAKLPLYKSLVPFTPELAQYKTLGVTMELVVGWSNANVDIQARDMNVKVSIFCPDWLQAKVDSMHNYWTAEYRQQRDQKLKLREFYGID